MSQYYAKLHVRVKSPDLWRKLFSLDLSEYYIDAMGQDIFDVSGNSFVIDDEWSLDEDGLESLVDAISSRLKKKCIVIGECQNINVDPYTYLVYYLGSDVEARGFDIYDDPPYDGIEGDENDEEDAFWDNDKMVTMMDSADINKIVNWLNYYSLYGPGFSKDELEYIKDFGIIAVESENGVEFEENTPNYELPSSIALTGTQYEGRIDRIEKIKVGDSVTLVREPDNEYDFNAIDVRNSAGSLGHLSADACEIISPLLDKDKITYTAKIDSVTPLSKRSKRCKTALVSIHVETKIK